MFFPEKRNYPISVRIAFSGEDDRILLSDFSDRSLKYVHIVYAPVAAGRQGSDPKGPRRGWLERIEPKAPRWGCYGGARNYTIGCVCLRL